MCVYRCIYIYIERDIYRYTYMNHTCILIIGCYIMVWFIIICIKRNGKR